MSDGAARIGNVLYPSTDMAASVAFYRDGLGLPVRFTDGDRFAALDGGGITLALAAGAEEVTGGVPAASVRVPDVGAAVAELTGRGAPLLRPAETGPHEVRAVVGDPAGNPVVLYSPLPPR
ncbi:VOC family protein [Nocardiopsis composta]|uniref:Catechol 2,3-dioxygenase-like lactoylglutathione lyase family enzyme n=1 Tax=Nocardiopsis composta TaxID=157465 RepID=A0A7W8VFZ8_9ACTN|nr:VOC family protein [Nocardiopsis composta]MBB5435101.1 catechol 2,3-dioxygenase-like lactoylglutathione lyase family enzyme [Nocardiopsis composta]